jgi:hypothetical protein
MLRLLVLLLLLCALLQWIPTQEVLVLLLCAGRGAAADQGRCHQLCPTGCAQLHLLGCVALRQGPHLLLRLLPPLIHLLLHLLLLMHDYQHVLHLL